MNYLFRILAVVWLLLLMPSGTLTKQLTISSLEPSPVDFSDSIRRIGIVNSSKVSVSKPFATPLEQIIAMDERYLTMKGTEASLAGLFKELVQNQQFDTILILDEPLPNFTAIGTRPSDEMWNRITAICEENSVDALFTLAYYEAETEFSLKKTKVEQINMIRDKSLVSGKELTLITLIENGWRIYYPKEKILIDEFTSTKEIVESAKGEDPIKALKAIGNRKEILLGKSLETGVLYGKRMTPKSMQVKRSYYATGTANFEKAVEQISFSNYDEALKLWTKEITNPKPKISARAYYNLAVINEFKGDIRKALQLATKSHQINETSSTVSYISILESRLVKNEIVKSQLVSTAYTE